MKNLRIVALLLLLVTVFPVVRGEVLEGSDEIIIMPREDWEGDEKSFSFIPIKAYLVDDSYIEIQSFSHESMPAVMEIVDSNGALCYEETLFLSDGSTYTINVSGLAPGSYSLVYKDDFVKGEGEFVKY